MKNFFKTRVLYPLLEQLKQGVTPQKMAMSCAVASVLSVFPIPGATTGIIFAFGVFFKLNHPTLQIVNYALTPIHFLLIPVFMRIGETIFHLPHVTFNPSEFIAGIKASPSLFLSQYGYSILVGVFSWFMLAPPVGGLIYRILLPIFRKKITYGAREL